VILEWHLLGRKPKQDPAHLGPLNERCSAAIVDPRL
jgi:hypothetical protein